MNVLSYLCAMMMVGQPASSHESVPQMESPTDAPALLELVNTFLESSDESERGRLVDRIAMKADGKLPDVVAALQSAQVWSSLEAGAGSVPILLSSGGVIEVQYRLPSDYDGSSAFPLILIAHNGSASETIERFAERLGDLLERYIVVCPQRWPAATFHHDPKEAVEFHDLVVSIRRAFHTNTDRWYVVGHGSSGDAAWLAAILHREVFAGVLVSAGYPKLPLAEHLYPILLPNLADTRILSVWHRSMPGADSPRHRSVVAHNHAVLDLARHGFVKLTGVEQSSPDESIPWPSRERLKGLLSARRAPLGTGASHWFRYGGQGAVGLLRQVQFRGDEWASSQLSILPGASVDRDSYVSEILKDHLAYLNCRANGTTYRLETRRCARVVLSLPYTHLKTEKPITVYCNGALRHDKPVAPSLHTMLDRAYATWDFARPVAAELSFSIRRDQP